MPFDQKKYRIGTMSRSEVVREFNLYQLVHEKDRTVGMADGPVRRLGDEIEESDSYTFYITRREDGDLRVAGEVFTITWKIQEHGGSYLKSNISQKSTPFVFPENTEVELIEPHGEGTGYEDPLSPVSVFQTGIPVIGTYNPDRTNHEPTLRIKLPAQDQASSNESTEAKLLEVGKQTNLKLIPTSTPKKNIVHTE